MSDVTHIDNSDGDEIEKCIAWQFEQAKGIVGFVDLLKDFFKASTQDFWDGWKNGIINIDNADGFSLSVLGNIIGITRASLVYADDGEDEPSSHLMSEDLFRKLIVCRARLMNTNASVPEYIRCLSIVFGNSLKVKDNLDMSMTFELDEDTATPELIALFNQRRDLVFVFPAGVDDATPYSGNIFALARDDEEDREEGFGGLDDSTFDWRQ